MIIRRSFYEKKILKEYFTGCLTVPNLLSFLRIVMVPIFAVLFHQGRYGWAVFVLALSGLSDFFDGKIARRFNQISNLGKMLDPVADKLTQITIAIMFLPDLQRQLGCDRQGVQLGVPCIPHQGGGHGSRRSGDDSPRP